MPTYGIYDENANNQFQLFTKCDAKELYMYFDVRIKHGTISVDSLPCETCNYEWYFESWFNDILLIDFFRYI